MEIEPEHIVSMVERFICIIGILLFGTWLLKTSFGRKALAHSTPRRNCMPLYMPLVPLFLWLGGVSFTMLIAQHLLADPQSWIPAEPGPWQEAFLANLLLGLGAIGTIVVIVVLVKASFARGLKGFGLHVKTMHKDLFAAIVNLLSIWPLLLVTIIIITFFGRLFFGQQYQIEQHTELDMITSYPQPALRVLIIIVAVIIGPVLEEMLFRGLVQTVIRSYLVWPWLSVAISSFLFAVAHEDVAHWPILLVLGLCMGYAYERSGSLLRPIFIHSLFNGVVITSVLIQ